MSYIYQWHLSALARAGAKRKVPSCMQIMHYSLLPLPARRLPAIFQKINNAILRVDYYLSNQQTDTMTSTRKRKSTSTVETSKKVKTEEELSATAEENEQQQVEEQQEQKTEEDSPTKKIAAANVLVAFSDAAGEKNEGEVDGEEIKGM